MGGWADQRVMLESPERPLPVGGRSSGGVLVLSWPILVELGTAQAATTSPRPNLPSRAVATEVWVPTEHLSPRHHPRQGGQAACTSVLEFAGRVLAHLASSWCTPRPLTGDKGRAGTVATTTRPTAGRADHHPDTTPAVRRPRDRYTRSRGRRPWRRNQAATAMGPRPAASSASGAANASADSAGTARLQRPSVGFVAARPSFTVRIAANPLHPLRDAPTCTRKIGTPLSECQ